MNRPANDAGPRDIGLYVINLESSTRPMPLIVPFRHELVGFSVFRSRAIEDGRERFRLHLGYFESEQRAADALAVVRKHYPAAWISSAPATNAGSLDDTLNTEFRLLRTAYARVVTPATAPAPGAAHVATSGVFNGPSLDADNRTAAPAAQSPQHYAVELDSSLVPILATDVPRLAIFDGYHLYTVRMLRPRHALRVGFFTSADEARQVAERARPEFPGVRVVPVSYREYLRAIELARQLALKAVAQATAPAASAVTHTSEGRVAPARAAALVLPATPPGTSGVVSPLPTPRA